MSKIECIPNGPFCLKGDAPLLDRDGSPVETEGEAYLCRCGGSKDKPFCDQTHQKINFDSKATADPALDQRKDYEGKEIRVHDNRAICSHAGYCTGGLPSVFNVKSRPWINADGAAAEKVAETVGQCPSGALSYSQDGEEHRDHQANEEVRAFPKGPYYVRGGVELEIEPKRWGQGASEEHYALCRCGASANKPFCDGAHRSSDFE